MAQVEMSEGVEILTPSGGEAMACAQIAKNGEADACHGGTAGLLLWAFGNVPRGGRGRETLVHWKCDPLAEEGQASTWVSQLAFCEQQFSHRGRFLKNDWVSCVRRREPYGSGLWGAVGHLPWDIGHSRTPGA